MRLNVGKFGVKQLFGAFDRQFFHLVDKGASAVIAPAGVAFCIFVGQNRTLRLKDGSGDYVFRSDQFNLLLLARQFPIDGCENFRVFGR